MFLLLLLLLQGKLLLLLQGKLLLLLQGKLLLLHGKLLLLLLLLLALLQAFVLLVLLVLFLALLLLAPVVCCLARLADRALLVGFTVCLLGLFRLLVLKRVPSRGLDLVAVEGDGMLVPMSHVPKSEQGGTAFTSLCALILLCLHDTGGASPERVHHLAIDLQLLFVVVRVVRVVRAAFFVGALGHFRFAWIRA